MKTLKTMALALGMVLLAGAAQAATDSQPTTTMPDVSVTATRGQRDMDKLSRNVTIIGRDEIQAMNPLTVTDVLRGQPGLFVRDLNGTGTQVTIDMRGFGDTAGRHVLVTVDGRRQNLLDGNGVDWTIIPVENIERIEILHGPAGVLYGDQAVGGVINIVTRKGSGEPSGKIVGKIGTYELYGGTGYFQGGYQDLGWFVSARHDSTDGYRDNSETRVSNATAQLRYDPSETFGILIDGVLSQSNFNLPGALTQAQYDSDPKKSYEPNQWYENTNRSVRGQVKKDFGAGGLLSLDVSYRSWSSESKSTYYTNLENDSDVWGIQPKYILDLNLGGIDTRTTAGLDWNFWQMDYHSTSSYGGGKAHFDDKLNSLGVYMFEEVFLTDKLVVSGGARYQHQDYEYKTKVDYSGEQSLDTDDSNWAWSAGLAYNFLPGSKVYARVASTFRYPIVDETTNFSTGAFWKLDPEKALSYEVGAEYAFMPGGSVSLSLYLMDMEDEIAWNSELYCNENLDDTRHMGVELAARVPVCDAVSLFGNLTYEDVEFTSGAYDGNKVPLVPEFMASLGVDWKIIADLNLRAKANYVSERYFGNDLDNSQNKMDDYTTVDLSLSYRWDRLLFYVNANNIFDEKYSGYGYYSSWSGFGYYPEAGATVWGGIGIEF